MISRRTMLALVPLVTAPGRARASEGGVSDWSRTDHARVRLIDAGTDAATVGSRLAGLQITLDPDFLTYWRTPGEAGVPPVADFAGSSNLAQATLLYPAPERFDEDGAETFGYKDDVVFPIGLKPTVPTQPVTLSVTLSFAVCLRLCLPAEAAAELRLDADGSSPEAGLVRDALLHVPIPSLVGGTGPLAVEGILQRPGDDAVVVTVRATGETAPRLFVEAADPWYLAAGAAEPAGAGRFAFPLRILGRARGGSTVPLRLTLANATDAIEVPVDLDVGPAKP